MSIAVEDAAALRRWDAQWLKYQDADTKARRELLKLSPLLAVGAFGVPSASEDAAPVRAADEHPWIIRATRLAGALMWHLTFMWVFTVTGAVYRAYQRASCRYRMVLFTRRDLPGVWLMVKHDFFFRAKLRLSSPTICSRNLRTRR